MPKFLEKIAPFLFEPARPAVRVSSDARKQAEEKLAEKTDDERQKLAHSPSATPAALDVLADDENVSVRRAVAGNERTPAETSIRMTDDEDEDVRLILVKRLVKLLPHLNPDQHVEVYALTMQALSKLAEDQVTHVRIALSSSLKDIARTPPDLARRLAADIEREVAEPIIKFSLSLSDDDLMEIIKRHPDSWHSEALAGRQHLAPLISREILEAGSDSAKQALASNETAELDQETLTLILDRAKDNASLLQAYQARRALPRKVRKLINEQLDKMIRKSLSTQSDLDQKTRQEVVDTTMRRLDWADDQVEAEAEEKPIENPRIKAQKLFKSGKLDDKAITDGLAWGETEFVTEAISLHAGLDYSTTEKILKSESARSVVSLVWSAGMSMRTAVAIQQKLMRLPTNKQLLAKGGVDFPLDDAEMTEQLKLFDTA